MINIASKHFDAIFEKIAKYKTYVVLVLAAVIVLVGGTLFYSYHTNSIEQKAQMAFVGCLKYFDAKIKTADLKPEKLSLEDIEIFSTPKEKWQAVVDVFKKGYEENKSSNLAPFFLALEAEGLVQLGKLDEAINLLSQAVGDIDSNDIADVYKIKLALMQLDTSSKTENAVGLESLGKIAEKSDSVANDSALYRLGEYYWINKDFDKAKNYWNQLVHKYGQKSKKPSPWAEFAAEKLKLIEQKV
jgi:tetratricopeptide (TPR) repeat protein